MVALDPIVAPLSVDMPDAVEMGVASVADFTDDAPICLGLVGVDRDRSVKPYPFDRLTQEGIRGLSIAPDGQPKVNHLTVCIDRVPQLAPLAANADISFIDVPVDARRSKVFLG